MASCHPRGEGRLSLAAMDRGIQGGVGTWRFLILEKSLLAVVPMAVVLQGSMH